MKYFLLVLTTLALATEYKPKKQVIIEIEDVKVKEGCLDDTVCTIKDLQLSMNANLMDMSVFRRSYDSVKNGALQTFVFTLYGNQLKTSDVSFVFGGVDPQFGFDRPCDESVKPYKVDLDKARSDSIQLHGTCFTLTTKISVINLLSEEKLHYEYLVKNQHDSNFQILLISGATLGALLIMVTVALITRRTCGSREKPLKVEGGRPVGENLMAAV
ncbi:unnamed protein product [Bursaphelenchus okinawaensis]|uniref:C2 domain-containing protein n=1 Tax=Bursaphelenchus okinawaensis TaxID=465554 RepID=A0A811KDG4_9BILA|nr:unnamed protein product [Bursaphelenchus okinawaensis]CAG9101661.1 unnamed protein product [Bursaphelenchus okinawaensis]